MRQDEIARQGTSVVRRQGTSTSSRVPAVRSTNTVVTQRQSLTAEQRQNLVTTRRSNQSKTRQSQDVSSQETLLLGQQPYLVQDPETWGDDRIPVFSRKKDRNFTVLALGTGMLVMIVLMMLGTMLLDWGHHVITHIQYGDHPVTMLIGDFGFADETGTNHTYIMAVNQDRKIVILVMPPDAKQTKSYVLPTYVQFASDDVPTVTKVTVQNAVGIKIQVNDMVWYLVYKNGQFIPAQL